MLGVGGVEVADGDFREAAGAAVLFAEGGYVGFLLRAAGLTVLDGVLGERVSVHQPPTGDDIGCGLGGADGEVLGYAFGCGGEEGFHEEGEGWLFLWDTDCADCTDFRG